MSNIILEQVSSIVQGSIYTRVKPIHDTDDSIDLDSISMQELNYRLGDSDAYDYSSVKVSKTKIDNCVLAKEYDILVGLTMQKAMVISKELIGKLVLSNFAIISILDRNILDPYYLCWLFNENNKIKKIIDQNAQGSSYVYTLSIATLRDIEIPIIDIELQRKIGRLYKLFIDKKQIEIKLKKLTEQLLKEKIEMVFKGEIK